MFYKNKKTILNISILLLSLVIITKQLFTVNTQQEIKSSVNLQAQKNKPHHKYRNIIFDMGAVLIYYNAYEIIKDMFKDDEVQPYELVGATKTDIYLDMDRGLKTRQEVVELLSKQYDKAKLTRFLADYHSYLRPLEEGIALFDAVRQKGYKTYILSNMSREVHMHIAHYPWLNQFDGAVFSYQVKSAKPDAAIYQSFLQKYHLDPAECLFIDDLQKNIDAAKSAGIDGIVCSSHAFVANELKRLSILD